MFRHDQPYHSNSPAWSPRGPAPPHRAMGHNNMHTVGMMHRGPRPDQQMIPNYSDLAGRKDHQIRPPMESSNVAPRSSTYYIALDVSQPTENTSGHQMLMFRKGDHLIAKQTDGGWYWGCVQGKETEVEHGYFSPNQVQVADGKRSDVREVKIAATNEKSRPTPKSEHTSAKNTTDEGPRMNAVYDATKQSPSTKALHPTKCSVGNATRGYGRRSDWTVAIECPFCMDSISVSLTLGLTKTKRSIRVQIERKYKCTVWKVDPLNGYKATGCVVKLAADTQDLVNRAANCVANLIEADAEKIEKRKALKGGKRNREIGAGSNVGDESDQKRAKKSQCRGREGKKDATPSSPKFTPPPQKNQTITHPQFEPPPSRPKSKTKKKDKNISPSTPSAKANPSSHSSATNAEKTDDVQKKATTIIAAADDADVAAGAIQNQPPKPLFYIPVPEDVAKQVKFPPGCSVVHESSNDNIVSGFVRSVHLKLASPILGKSTYLVCYKLATEGNFIGDCLKDIVAVPEEALQFATKCPVLIPASFAPQLFSYGGDVNAADSALTQGAIISSYKSICDSEESYIISLADGGRVSGVPRDLVRFRPPSWKEPLRTPTMFSGVAFDNTSKQSEPPVAVVSTLDDASRVSEVSLPPSTTISGVDVESEKCLRIPNCIDFDGVKTHLYNGDTSERMGKKLGVEVHVVGNDLQPADLVRSFGASFSIPSFNGKYLPCVLLKGGSKRIQQAVKVIAHILLEKVYEGSNKEGIRRQLLTEVSSETIPKDDPAPSESMNGSGSSRGGRKPADEESEAEDHPPVGIFGGFDLPKSDAQSSSKDSLLPCSMSFSELSRIISNIVAAKGPMRVGNINAEFRKKFGVSIDFKNIGFEKLTDLVKKVPLVYVEAQSFARHVEYMVYSKVQEVKDNVVLIISGADGPIDGNTIKRLYENKFGAALNIKGIGYEKLKTFFDSIPSVRTEMGGKNKTEMKVVYCGVE